SRPLVSGQCWGTIAEQHFQRSKVSNNQWSLAVLEADMRHKGHLFETIAIAAVASCIGVAGLSLAQNATPPRGGSAILPPPEPAFSGVIGRKASESRPDYPPAITAPKGAPNVLLIMTDDTGFGAASTFGGPIPTPNLERVYQSGVC